MGPNGGKRNSCHEGLDRKPTYGQLNMAKMEPESNSIHAGDLLSEYEAVASKGKLKFWSNFYRTDRT
jgi:hypothetical protein